MFVNTDNVQGWKHEFRDYVRGIVMGYWTVEVVTWNQLVRNSVGISTTHRKKTKTWSFVRQKQNDLVFFLQNN